MEFISDLLDPYNEEFESNHSKQVSSSGPSIIHQQPRSSLTKWLCTTAPANADKPVSEQYN